ncbi:DNA cytosine methyltransferase [Entomomonas sp. E2T0]|uniref:DNA cytosine methyltransferase n=1 Tax=Entomomonas sp. E2T0 TaxID=2930213 RepID=UPI0022281E99|nr:DNA cytosine methyltransferase [Entomomonas sp. E2T0]UYZ83177.1 DNA cytosine methyltransferase [Entomomonas sp. E2T0]
MHDINVLSLFDGISVGRLALDRAGISVKNYYASEIDKYAIKVSENNYPDIIRLGDINNWQQWNVDWSSIDLILAGSPCQSFSIAGKQLAFDDPRGKLFFVFVNILNHVKKFNQSVKFLLENVRMKKEFIKVISDYLNVDQVVIDSALLSAQSRKRLYWCNWQITQPEDKGILLKDIIEHGFVDRDKSYCIDANYHKGSNFNNYFEKSRRQMVFLDKEYKDFRILTPIECERLQTLPVGFTDGISNTQRYRCLGNGWTVDVIAHILKCLVDQPEISNQPVVTIPKSNQLSLFN